jgi:hypothetical protein
MRLDALRVGGNRIEWFRICLKRRVCILESSRVRLVVSLPHAAMLVLFCFRSYGYSPATSAVSIRVGDTFACLCFSSFRIPFALHVGSLEPYAVVIPTANVCGLLSGRCRSTCPISVWILTPCCAYRRASNIDLGFQ